MSASPSLGGRRLLAAAVARAGSWLIEPAESAAEPIQIRERPVVAVIGLAPRCGTTAVARALAVELGIRDAAGGAAVAGEGSARAGPLAVPLTSADAARLSRTIRELTGGAARTVGRLCLVATGDAARLAAALRHAAPLVLDVGHGTPPGTSASLADHTVLVGSPRTEPALAAVVADSLARVGPEPIVVVNRAHEPDAWERARFVLPDARAGAQLALAGRRAAGPLATAIADVADACERPRAKW